MTKIDKKYHTGKYLKEYIPILKEVFIEYYGQDWQELIDDRLNNFAFVGYMSDTQMTNLVYTLKMNISDKVAEQFMQETGFDLAKKADFFVWGFDIFEQNHLNRIINRKKYFEKDVDYLFDLKTTDEDYQIKFAECLKKVDETKDSLYKYKDEYDKELKKYQEYIDIDNRYKELIKNCKSKYIREFIYKIYDFLPQEDKDYYEEKDYLFYLDSTAADSFRKMKIYPIIINNILGQIDFTTNGYIDAFSEENENNIQNPLYDDDEKKWIINDRIRYYKKLGLDLGDDYQSYINNPEANKLTPSFEDIEKINKIKKEIHEKIIRDFYSTIDMYKENEKTLKNSGLMLNDKIPYLFETYQEKNWCITNNVKKINDKLNTILTLYPILLFNTKCKEWLFDQILIHELNHIIENRVADYENFYNEKGNFIKFDVECGFDFSSDTYKVPILNKRKYEMFSEVVNDIIADEITDLMHKKGIYLFTEKTDKQVPNNSVYEYAKPLVKDFFKYFKKELIYARLTGIKTKLFNTIGEDNFNELNDLINEFYIYFGCAHGDNKKIEETLQKIKEGKVTKDTKKYQDFIELSQVVFEQMKDYKNVKKKKLVA